MDVVRSEGFPLKKKKLPVILKPRGILQWPKFYGSIGPFLGKLVKTNMASTTVLRLTVWFSPTQFSDLPGCVEKMGQ